MVAAGQKAKNAVVGPVRANDALAAVAAKVKLRRTAVPAGTACDLLVGFAQAACRAVKPPVPVEAAAGA